MEFRIGDIVINPSMPQWGEGEVLAVTEGKVMVQFKRHGVRKMSASFLARADTGECPEPAAAPRPSARKSGTPAKERKSTGTSRSAEAEPGDLFRRALAMMKEQGGADDVLAQAERSVSLKEDARKKAVEDARRQRCESVIRFWRDAEIFLVPEVPRSSRPPVTSARRWETVSASLPIKPAGRPHEEAEDALSGLSRPDAPCREFPWMRPLPSGFTAAWHIVYLGVLPRQSAARCRWRGEETTA